MKFYCKACGKTSHSAADIEWQKNPNCPHCGASETFQEVVDENED